MAISRRTVTAVIVTAAAASGLAFAGAGWRRAAADANAGSAATTGKPAAANGANGNQTAAKHSDAEWCKILTPEQYRILRGKNTELAFTGRYWDNHKNGTYYCAACGQPLFRSTTKYDSGTGWPSFWAPIKPGCLRTEVDTSMGMRRVEVLCARCGGHLGHVFEDGPKPTGLRYCMNSGAMKFVEQPPAKKATTNKAATH